MNNYSSQNQDGQQMERGGERDLNNPILERIKMTNLVIQSGAKLCLIFHNPVEMKLKSPDLVVQ